MRKKHLHNKLLFLSRETKQNDKEQRAHTHRRIEYVSKRLYIHNRREKAMQQKENNKGRGTNNHRGHMGEWRDMKKKKNQPRISHTRGQEWMGSSAAQTTHARTTTTSNNTHVSKESGEERRRERGTRMRTKHALTNGSMVIKKKRACIPHKLQA